MTNPTVPAYKVINDAFVYRIDQPATIPLVEANRDYQEYKKWLAAGNTPQPADS